jgi:uncharacterized protein
MALLGCTSTPTSQPGVAGTSATAVPSDAGAWGTRAAAGSASVVGGSGSNSVGGAPPDAAPDAPPDQLDSGSDASDAAVPVLPKRVLLYHFSTLDIPTVPAQLTLFENKLADWQYDADESVDPTELTDQNLERYSAVAMINTCFEPFGKGQPDEPQSGVLQRFLRRGGGLFGTHCASVTFQSENPPALYNQLIGGRGGDGFFDGTSTCSAVARHPSTSGLGASFSFVGNLDNTDFLALDSVVLVRCKWQSDAGADVAVSWYRSEGQGRVFYTDFAKVDADLRDPVLGAHIFAGLAWVLRMSG